MSVTNYDMRVLPTYVFYDSLFSTLLSKLNIYVPEEVIGEYRDDKEILDFLYKSELSNAFNQDNAENIEFEKYDIIVKLFQHDFINECIQIIKHKNIIPLLDHDKTNDQGIHSEIVPLFFSYHLFFFTHMCLQDMYANNGDIQIARKTIIKNAIEELL
jgi:hypothetical protein